MHPQIYSLDVPDDLLASVLSQSLAASMATSDNSSCPLQDLVKTHFWQKNKREAAIEDPDCSNTKVEIEHFVHLFINALSARKKTPTAAEPEKVDMGVRRGVSEGVEDGRRLPVLWVSHP
jgi:hypothetical protein